MTLNVLVCNQFICHLFNKGSLINSYLAFHLNGRIVITITSLWEQNVHLVYSIRIDFSILYIIVFVPVKCIFVVFCPCPTSAVGQSVLLHHSMADLLMRQLPVLQPNRLLVLLAVQLGFVLRGGVPVEQIPLNTGHRSMSH